MAHDPKNVMSAGMMSIKLKQQKSRLNNERAISSFGGDGLTLGERERLRKMVNEEIQRIKEEVEKRYAPIDCS